MYSIIHSLEEGMPMRSPRERMVVSAALLIRERGAHATAISDVLAHSGAPRGSAYHYFPGGRTQLLCEAVDYAGDHVGAVIAEADSGLELLDTLIDKYRRQLLDSDFRAGCPIVAVSVESGDGEDRERMAARGRTCGSGIRPLDRPDRAALDRRRHTCRAGRRTIGADHLGTRGRHCAGPGAARRGAAGSHSPSAAHLAAGCLEKRREVPR